MEERGGFICSFLFFVALTTMCIKTKTTYITVSRFAVRRGLDRRRRSGNSFGNKYCFIPATLV